MGKLKVLFVAADAGNDGRTLNVLEEMRRIEQRVRLSEYREALRFDYCTAARPLDLIQALNIHRPDAVHFSGHGEADGSFLFVGDTGEARAVSPDALADVFRKVRGKVRLVVVNACQSKPIARAVSDVVDCAVGMTQPIMDESAIVFSEMFYGALGFALSVREAFDQGTLGIGVEARPGREVPELFARPGVDPMRVVLVTARPHTPCDAALAVVRDELQRNLQTLAARITHTLASVPTGDPVPQRPGEPRSAFDDRDRRWFTHAVGSELASGYAQFPLDTGGYDAHRLNLAECDAVRRGSAERAYAALAESDKRLAMYRSRLGTLADGRQTSELRTRCAGLYSRQTATELAILWCQVLEGWAMLDPDEAQVQVVGAMLVPQVLRGTSVEGRFAPGAEGREFALQACAALYGVKAGLLEEEMRLMPRAAPVRRPSTALEAIVAAGLAWVEGRPEESVAAFEQALSFADAPADQRHYAETSLAYLRDPDRFGGVLGTYLLDVEPGGAAAEAGLHAGDVIVAYHAAPVTEPNVLSRLISHARGAPLVQVEVVRDGHRLARFVKGGASLSARGATLVVGDSFAV